MIRKISDRKVAVAILYGLLSISIAFSEDENQYLSDSIDFETPLEKNLKNKEIKIDEAHAPAETATDEEFEKKYKKIKNSSHIVGENQDLDPTVKRKERLKGRQLSIPGTHEKDDTYLELDLVKEYREVSKAGERNFSFIYYVDKYSYHDDQKSFLKTYRDEGSSAAGILRFSGHQLFFNGKFVNLAAGLAMGLGYNSGSGRYTGTNIIAPAKLFLWTMPIDLSFMVEASLSRFLKLSLAGGPSVLGIWQHRNDLEEGNKLRDLRQVSPGVFYEGRANISLSDFFPRLGLNMFYEYSITKMFLTLSARGGAYEKFKDSDVRIKGLSLGAGLTFEYF